MGKKNVVIIILIVLILLVLVFGVAFYFYFIKSENINGGGRMLINPVKNLSNSEAVEQFDEDFVLYLLYAIGANELKKSPISLKTPKIEIRVGDKIFSAEIIKGNIMVNEGGIEQEDIIIYTTTLEAVKMIRNRSYIEQSFSSGKTGIELIAGKATLAAKGYLKIYTKLTGKSVNVSASNDF
jgi:hypothetical protein